MRKGMNIEHRTSNIEHRIKVDRFIGTPFVDGGRGPHDYDCWGLVMAVFRVFGVTLPDFEIRACNARAVGGQIMASMADARSGRKGKDEHRTSNIEHRTSNNSVWEELARPEAPCIIAIKNHPRMVNHCGVYVGEGMFLHTMAKIGCVQDRIESPMWRKRLRGFFRLKNG